MKTKRITNKKKCNETRTEATFIYINYNNNLCKKPILNRIERIRMLLIFAVFLVGVVFKVLLPSVDIDSLVMVTIATLGCNHEIIKATKNTAPLKVFLNYLRKIIKKYI